MRIINRRLIFQNNWVKCGFVQEMYNKSCMHACTQPSIRCRKYYFQYFQSRSDHKTCLCSFISMLNFQQCISVGEEGGGQYLYKGCGRLTRAVSAHTSIHSGSSDPTRLYPNRSETLWRGNKATLLEIFKKYRQTEEYLFG